MGRCTKDILSATEDRRKGTHVIAPSVGCNNPTPVNVESRVSSVFAGARSAEVLPVDMAAAPPPRARSRQRCQGGRDGQGGRLRRPCRPPPPRDRRAPVPGSACEHGADGGARERRDGV